MATSGKACIAGESRQENASHRGSDWSGERKTGETVVNLRLDA